MAMPSPRLVNEGSFSRSIWTNLLKLRVCLSVPAKFIIKRQLRQAKREMSHRKSEWRGKLLYAAQAISDLRIAGCYVLINSDELNVSQPSFSKPCSFQPVNLLTLL